MTTFDVGDTFCIFIVCGSYFLYARCFCLPPLSVTVFYQVYAHEVEVCDDVSKLICNIQFCTTSISRAFGPSLCLMVLSVGSSVAAIVPSQLLLSAHLQMFPDWEIPSYVSAAETHAQCSSGTDHRKSISVVAAGNERRTRCTWACLNGDRSWPSVVAQRVLPLRA